MIYKIKPGNHRSVWFPQVTFKRSICFTFTFLSKMYETEHTNKVYGLIDGIFPHHNSIRVGFRKIGDNIELSAIVYNDGVRTITPLKLIKPFYVTTASIVKHRNTYEIILDLERFVFKRTSRFNLFSFRLFPYWGGVPTANSLIKIEIR